MTTTSEAALIANVRDGKWPSPVSFAQRIRSSTRACARWRASRRQLSERGVGGERGVAPAVGLFERVELRAGVRTFTADDDPSPSRVADHAARREGTGDLGQPG